MSDDLHDTVDPLGDSSGGVFEPSTSTVDDSRRDERSNRSKPHHPETEGDSGVTGRDLINIVERRRTVDEPGSFLSKIWTTDMRLPGFGERRETCGDDLPFFCSDCGESKVMGQTCYEWTCPRCAPAAARRRARDLCCQLEQARRIRADQRENHQRFHHLAISPPARWDPDTTDEWETGAEVVREMLEAADLEGIIVYHPYRGADGDDRGEWKGRLFDEVDWSDVEDDLAFAPHYHAIVVGHKCPGGDVTRALESETGWLFHRITKEDSDVSLYDEYDLARAMSYCLSHVGLYETDEQVRAAVRKAGMLKPGTGPSWDPHNNEEDMKLRRQYDAVVRSVAPMTLGLDYNDLACSEEYDPREDPGAGAVDEKVDLDRGQGSRQAHHHTTGTMSDPVASGDVEQRDELLEGLGAGVTSDDGLDVDALNSLDPDPERCNGRMLGLGQAPRYLDDDEWRRDARHADDLVETWREWSDRLDWLPEYEPGG